MSGIEWKHGPTEDVSIEALDEIRKRIQALEAAVYSGAALAEAQKQAAFEEDLARRYHIDAIYWRELYEQGKAELKTAQEHGAKMDEERATWERWFRDDESEIVRLKDALAESRKETAWQKEEAIARLKEADAYRDMLSQAITENEKLRAELANTEGELRRITKSEEYWHERAIDAGRELEETR